MKWHEKTLKKYKTEIITSSVAFTVFIASITLWSYFSRESFVWTKIEPVSYPSILNWRFYSALAFVTIGSFLFSQGFWLFIYKISYNRSSFRRNKKDVWKLIILSTFGLVVLAVWLLNTVISIIFNIAMLVVFLLPSVFITTLLIILGRFLYKRFFSKVFTH